MRIVDVIYGKTLKIKGNENIPKKWGWKIQCLNSCEDRSCNGWDMWREIGEGTTLASPTKEEMEKGAGER